jgi:hypothetical protein
MDSIGKEEEIKDFESLRRKLIVNEFNQETISLYGENKLETICFLDGFFDILNPHQNL